MSRWQVQFSDQAEKDVSSLSKVVRIRILAKLEWLEKDFDNITPLSLSFDWAEFYKLRVGDYRVIYRILWEQEVIVVEAIDHRSKIHKRRR